GKNKFACAPTEGISASWKRVVFKGDMISSCPYTFWAIEKMLEGIKNWGTVHISSKSSIAI
ncbi:MAG TPA: hypothetical protein VIK78_22865, partial [Ruminiclostridium sp.]